MKAERQLEQLLAARQIRQPESIASRVTAIRATLFDKQAAFEADASRRKAALCTRRAGKTDLIPKKQLMRGLTRPESIRIYNAITRVRAKELLWRPLEKICAQYNLGGTSNFNRTTATITLPNHAVIRLRGADDMAESQKNRGDKLDEVDIDEAQIYPPEVLQNLVEDVYGPALEDTQGELSVYGTPGIVCRGKWFDMTRPDVDAREKGWSLHSWSVLDNPYMAHMKQRLPELKAERGWADDNPTYLREWLGLWVLDNTALFYKFDPTRDVHLFPLEYFLKPGWEHTLGWDIGLKDEMALVVWASHPREKVLYEAWSWKKSGHEGRDDAGADLQSGWRQALVDLVVKQIHMLEEMGFQFYGKVADTGGMGAFIVEQVLLRHGIKFEAAKKADKAGHVRFFNDELAAGRVKLRHGSLYAQEISVLPKDPEGDPLKEPEEDKRFPNHCADAGLYGWRQGCHWLYEEEKEKEPPHNSPEWHEAEKKRMQAQAEAEYERELAALEAKNKEKREALGDEDFLF